MGGPGQGGMLLEKSFLKQEFQWISCLRTPRGWCVWCCPCIGHTQIGPRPSFPFSQGRGQEQEKLQLITSFPLHTHTILNSNLSPLNTVTSPSLLSFLDFCIYFLLILSAFHSKHVLLRMWQMTRGKTTGRILGSISYSTLSSKISLLKSWLP